MATDLQKKGDNLMAALVKDVKDKIPILEKLKAMSKLASEIGEGAPEVDAVVETAESFAKMVIDRFEKKKPTE